MQLDLVCTPSIQINQIGAWYFIGYGLGIVFFMLPDLIGRKGAMKFIMPLNIIGCYMTIYTNTLFLKTLGYFIQGVFHLKVSTSFMHLQELVPEEHRDKAVTIVTSIDSSMVIIGCFLLQFVNNNETDVTGLMFWIGCVAIVLYFLLVPESPSWTLRVKGDKLAATKAGNFIA